MHKVFVAAATLLAALLQVSLLLLLPLSSRVYAQSSPHVFVGEATIDGAPVPDVTLVQGINDERILAGAEATVQNGKFTLFAQKPGGRSTSLQFAVGGSLLSSPTPGRSAVLQHCRWTLWP